MKLTDVVAVIGPKSRATELAEALCRSFGIRLFYAMKKANPSQRIDSCDDEATVSAPFETLPENIFRLGLMAGDPLFEDGTIDCNFTEDREILGHLLGWIAHRIESPADLPAGWELLDATTSPMQAGFDPRVDYSAVGQILADGKMIVDFGQGMRLLRIPDDYQDAFSFLEGFCI